MIIDVLTKKKLIESPLANRAGLQVARIVFARLALWMRGRPLSGGVALLPNFLSPADLELVRKDFAEAIDSRGVGAVDGYGLEATKASVLPGSATELAVFGDERWKRIFRKRESCKSLSLMELEARFERITRAQSPNPERAFSTAIVHSDTFHSVTKAFLFLEETGLEHGAFKYAMGSNRLSPARLAFEYRNSNGRFEYSPQPTEDELRRMAVDLKAVTCPANTLMIVDAFGFHARGIVQAGFERHAVCWEYRSNPFTLK
jgi:hypothetical protein